MTDPSRWRIGGRAALLDLVVAASAIHPGISVAVRRAGGPAFRGSRRRGADVARAPAGGRVRVAATLCRQRSDHVAGTPGGGRWRWSQRGTLWCGMAGRDEGISRQAVASQVALFCLAGVLWRAVVGLKFRQYPGRGHHRTIRRAAAGRAGRRRRVDGRVAGPHLGLPPPAPQSGGQGPQAEVPALAAGLRLVAAQPAHHDRRLYAGIHLRDEAGDPALRALHSHRLVVVEFLCRRSDRAPPTPWPARHRCSAASSFRASCSRSPACCSTSRSTSSRSWSSCRSSCSSTACRPRRA